MNTTMIELCQLLESELDKEEHEEIHPVRKYLRCVSIAKHYLSELRLLVQQEGFTSTEDEIHFFKEIKPRFEKYFIYYARLHQAETQRPQGKGAALKRHLRRELKRIENHYKYHRDFYTYYRSGSSVLDEQFFTRANQDQLIVSEYSGFMDTSFSTTHSFLVARLEADAMLETCISRELESLRIGTFHTPVILPGKTKQNRPVMNWSATKVSLVELCYAIHSFGAISPATIDVKKIAACLSDIFNVPLENIHKTYEEIRMRKKNRTPFLNALIQSLNRKMDFDDENSP